MSSSDPTRKFDVVYLLARSRWNEEIRYSLRSFEKFFPDLGRVWICGYLPPYLDRRKVCHIPEPPMPHRGVFVESVAKQWLNDHLDDLSEEYIFAQDDNYVLRPVSYVDFAPLWLEDLSDIKHRGTSPWKLMLWRTYDLLKFQGYPALNFEAHTPVQVNRTRYRQVAERFSNIESAARHRYQSYCTVSAYWNIVAGEKERYRRADEVRIGFTSKSRKFTEQEVHRKIEKYTFLFHDDHGLSSQLKSVLKKLFPEKSRYET